MNLARNLGLLALGSRLKMLAELLYQDVSRVYQSRNLDFEPRFFLVFYILINKKGIKITDLTRETGLSQPLVSQTTESMAKKGLVKFIKDKNDERIKLVTLSKKGQLLVPVLEKIWKDILSVHEDLSGLTGTDIIYVIEKIEDSLKQRSLYERIIEKSKQREINTVDIVDYSLPLRACFKELNYQWLKKYFSVEERDEKMLSNPERYVLKKGGFILFSRVDGCICGTVAMVKHKDGSFEMTKMCVNEKYQGRQIGKKLAVEAIKKAKKLGAKKIFLETSKDLVRAVGLYKKLGFREIPYKNGSVSGYERPTFKMEFEFNISDL